MKNKKYLNLKSPMNEDVKKVLALGLYTPSQSIATADLRCDSLQIIIGILAHSKFPASKKELMECAHRRKAQIEVTKFIEELPSEIYKDLASVIETVIHKKLYSTKIPYNMN